MEHVKTLLENDWIEKCECPWGSSIVLADKPYQEHVKNIDNFIWRMCVSYKILNVITNPQNSQYHGVMTLLQLSIQDHNLYE